jgi:hypothetical protein
VSAAERRRGRRDNGLDAADWRAIDDLDPRVSEEVLEALGARGIAAYVQPAMDVDPITRSTTIPSRPSDRLYVDRRRIEAARDCLRSMLDRPRRPADLDVTFAGIVADFHRPVDPTAAPWPALEDATSPTGSTIDTSPPEPEPERPAAPVDARHVTEHSLLDGLDEFGADLPDALSGGEANGGAGAEPLDLAGAEEPPERFVPPPPPPLPRLSRQAVLGTLAILAGLVLLLGQPDVLPLDRSSSMLLGFATVLAGAVALIMRLRPDPDPDEDPPSDDGAQV